MGIANDMKKLGEDIVASHDVRVKTIGTLVNNVHKTLKSCATDRKKMAIEQSKALGKFVSDLSKNVSNMINRIRKEHKEMADKLKADLAKGEAVLAKGEADRLKAFRTMMAGIQEQIKEIETYVKNKLKEFSDTHADMSEELKKELATYVDDIVNATKKLMADIQAQQKKRKEEVADLLAEANDLLKSFKTEREKMEANWRALTAKMAQRRGFKPEVEAGVKVRPVKEAIEEAVEEVKEEEASLEISLEERVLEVIKSHPEGVSVGDMEEPLGVSRLRLGKIAKTLLNEGKVRKEENLYFPLEE